MIFIDANVPIYVAGRDHPLREPCTQVLQLVVQRPEAFFTDAEVLQELLHRYLALHIWHRARADFNRFATLMRGRVEPIYVRDVQAAAELADQQPELSARDLIHAAVMARVGTNRIVSADRGFDRLRHLERLHPSDFAAWGTSV